jgi:hypothetical protein
MCCSITVLPISAARRAGRAGLCRSGDHVDDAAGDVFFALMSRSSAGARRVQRRQVLEHDLVLDASGGKPLIDVELGQREVAFAILRGADFALDGVAGAQVEAADLRRARRRCRRLAR